MHLQSTQAQVLEFGGTRVNGFDPFVSNSKFVFVSTGGDLLVSAGLYIGIYPHGYRSDSFQTPGNTVDSFQLLLTLGVERIDVLLKRQLDFGFGFANPGEHTFMWVGSSGEHAL